MAIDKKVIDISQYNTISSYKNIINNTDGCIIRLGYRGYGSSGTLVPDAKFSTNINSLYNALQTASTTKKNNYALGIYWFPQAISIAEARAEADFISFVLTQQASGISINFPIYLDSEIADTVNHNGRADNLSKADRTKYLIETAEKLKGTYGYKVGIYASESWYYDHLNLSTLVNVSSIESFWVAKYSSSQPSSSLRSEMGNKYHAWQYTSAASISGINSCDCSHFYKWWRGDEPEPTQIDISTKSASLSYTTTVFDGEEKTPTITISGVPTTGYTVAYTNNINAGTATVKATGKSPNYKGTKSLTFTITQPDISNTTRFDVSLAVSDYTYDGTAKKPAIQIVDMSRRMGMGSYELVEGTDYTATYTNNINAGNATVTMTGKGNYKGTVSRVFYIAPASIEGKTINGCSDFYKYTGSRITPDVTIDGLTKGVDYLVTYGTNVNVGQGSVTCTGKRNFVGDITKFFLIASFDIGNCQITIAKTPTYDGKPKTPKVVVKDTELSMLAGYNATLVEGRDFSVVYSNNINATTAACAHVSGMGMYSGAQTKTFTIKPYSITNFNMWIERDNYPYRSKEICPDVIVESLTKGVDYKLLYADNINIGKGKVTVVGINNYCDDITIKFDITPQDIQKCIAKLGYPSLYTRYRVIDDEAHPFRIYTPDEIIIVPGQAPIDPRYKLQPSIDYEIEKATRERMEATFYLYYYKVKGLNGFTGTAEFRFRMITPTDVPIPTAEQLVDDGVYQFGCVGGGSDPVVPETAEGNWDWGIMGEESDHDNHDTHTKAEKLDEYAANHPDPNVWVKAYTPADQVVLDEVVIIGMPGVPRPGGE